MAKTEKITAEMAILLAVIITIETSAQLLLDKATYSKNKLYLIAGIICYNVMAYLYYLLLFKGNLGILNAVWNAISTLVVSLLGFVLFTEKMSIMAIFGMILTVIGVGFMSV
jgi:multidrug transporter EmrE-like cation transporter